VIDFIGYDVGQSGSIMVGFFGLVDFTGIPVGINFIFPSGGFFDLIMV